MIQFIFHKLWKVQCLPKDFSIFRWGVSFIITGRLSSCFHRLGLMIVSSLCLCSFSPVQTHLPEHPPKISYSQVITCVRHRRFGEMKGTIITRQTSPHFISCVHVVKNGLAVLKLRLQLPIMPLLQFF